jgi:hypothetical protein
LLCVFPPVRCQFPALSFIDLLIPLQKYLRTEYVTFLYTENLQTNGECLSS